jgi:hypothetical protein
MAAQLVASRVVLSYTVLVIPSRDWKQAPLDYDVDLYRRIIVVCGNISHNNRGTQLP